MAGMAHVPVEFMVLLLANSHLHSEIYHHVQRPTSTPCCFNHTSHLEFTVCSGLKEVLFEEWGLAAIFENSKRRRQTEAQARETSRNTTEAAKDWCCIS